MTPRPEFGPSCSGAKGHALALDVKGARAYVSPIAAARGDAGAWMWSWGAYYGPGVATADLAVAAFWTFIDTHTAQPGPPADQDTQP